MRKSVIGPTSSPPRSTRLGVEPGTRVGDVLLEQPGAPRGLPGDPEHGRGAPHAEHPPLPRAAHVRHQPRGRRGRHRRRIADTAAGQGRTRPHDGAHVRRDRKRRRGRARRSHRSADRRVRGSARGRAARLRVAGGRRARRRGHVLHERHDRQPEGRRLLAPLDVAALVRRDRGQLARAHRSGPHPADRPDVPRERVGAPVRRLARRRRTS